MGSPAQALVAQRLADNGTTLKTWRDEGLTLAEVRDRLRDDYGITISIETVRRWLDTDEQVAS